MSQKGFFTIAIVEDSQVPARSDSLQLSIFVLLPFCGNDSTALGDLVRQKHEVESFVWVEMSYAVESSAIRISSDMKDILIMSLLWVCVFSDSLNAKGMLT